MTLSLLPYILVTIGLLGLLSSVLLVAKCKFFAPNIYLGVCILSLSLCTFCNSFFLTSNLQHVPAIFIIGKSFIYLVAPCAYLYIKNALALEYNRRKFDFLHFLPPFFILILLCNESLLNPQEFRKAITAGSINGFVSTPYAGSYFYLSFAKSLIWLFYCVLQSMEIIKFEKREGLSPVRYNVKLINWIKLFNISLIGLFSAVFVIIVANFTFISKDFTADLCFSGTLLILLFFLSVNPYILYSIDFAKLQQRSVLPLLINDGLQNKKFIPSTAKTKLKPELVSDYLARLEKVMADERPFLNKKITVAELSARIGIPKHHLTYLISQEMDLYFPDYINMQRVKYFKENCNNTRWPVLTLEAIGQEIGFNSRTTFFRAFIKLNGISPSEYLHNRKMPRARDN
ncbi:helix-turn-helix domain-containing protein [Mucilaginibacter jinjuensis]|uniref:AraC family transcriptional regulator n=1 Tax=Mucilaginibacter jinjuensis TaxID=1176721 RepID=A0ABY7T7Q2_9SPHI|nr:AraC family transcriptional regulator [Mucilaginibacter jinjuensis]WCT12279.1 AraC family transcriptional regulator [Mucilaginibacter jinjuensis]